ISAASANAAHQAPEGGSFSDQGRELELRIREAPRIDLLARGNKVGDLVSDAPHVDVHAGEHPAAAAPEDNQLTSAAIAAHDDLVPLRRVPGVFHAEVVLIREEVRDPV